MGGTQPICSRKKAVICETSRATMVARSMRLHRPSLATATGSSHSPAVATCRLKDARIWLSPWGRRGRATAEPDGPDSARTGMAVSCRTRSCSGVPGPPRAPGGNAAVDAVGDLTDTVTDAVGELAEKVTDAVGGLTAKVTDKVTELADKADHRLGTLADNVDTSADESLRPGAVTNSAATE